jgi:hypothetical protein
MNHEITPRSTRAAHRRIAGATVALGAAAALAVAVPALATSGGYGDRDSSVRASVQTPARGDTVSGGFNVDLSLQAMTMRGNRQLSAYKTAFIDPTGSDGKPNPAFHPGASATAPGLVVTLSTTPNKPGTPLAGPRTNLAGVFQINSVTQLSGLTTTHHDWQITSPGFFGLNTRATLTAYAVRGRAPDVVPQGGLTPISNVVRTTFDIGGS